MALSTSLSDERIQLPLLPLRDVVIFPHMVIPLFVGRPKSIKALETAMEAGKSIMLVAQKTASKDEPSPEDIYEIGCVSNILQMLKLPDGTVKVLVEGAQRARIHKIEELDTHFVCDLTPVAPDEEANAELEAMRRAIVQQFDQYVKLNKKIPPEILTSLSGIDDSGRLADTIAAHLPLKLEQKQAVLEMFKVSERLEHLLAARDRARHPAGREAHPRPREAADGEEPARVLPQRTGQGDPEGTRRRRGRRRDRGAREEAQGRPHAEGSQDQGRRRAQEAQADVADVGRGDGRAQLPRHAGRPAVEEEEQGHQRPQARRAGPRRRPLRPRQGQGTHPGISRGPAARRQAEGADPVPRRPSRRGQDVARAVDRPCHEPQVRAHGAGWRARRGRDPRASPHLHRLDAGQDPAEPGEGRRAQSALPARRGRQDGPWTSAATPRRPCSRCSIRNRTTRSRTTTSRSTSTCPT